MGKKTHRRTHYLIKKEFQLRYTITIVAIILTVMLISGIGLYIGMWSSIIENFSKFRVSEDLETVKRIAGYEETRFKKGDFRLERVFREAELLSAKERETLHDALNSVNKSLIPKIMVLAVFIFIGGIFISHRIAGPMYRFQKTAEAIRGGDLSGSFSIRKTDEMKEMALTLDEMVGALRKDMEKIKNFANEGKAGEINKIVEKYKT